MTWYKWLCPVLFLVSLSGCRTVDGNAYPEVPDDGFEPLEEETEIAERIAAGGNMAFRYEFVTAAPFGGEGVLPALTNNTRQVRGKDRKFEGRGSYVRREGGLWNFCEVFIIGGAIEVYLNGYLVTTGAQVTAETKWIGYQGKEQYRDIRWKVLPEDATFGGDPGQHLPCPPGFTAFYNGRPEQLREMWKGVTTTARFDNPFVRREMSKEEREAMQIIADEARDEHWSVRNGVIFFDGLKGGYSLATKRDFGDFELWADWRLVSVTGDSGLYLRGCPQVQVWDARNQWHVGSGGLYNNKVNPRRPLVYADKPVGEWNRFHVIMRGDKVTVWLNGELVVDETPLENYWDRKRPIPAVEQIELQCHGDPIEWRNVFIKEL